jgi:hypothetical protein
MNLHRHNLQTTTNDPMFIASLSDFPGFPSLVHVEWGGKEVDNVVTSDLLNLRGQVQVKTI